MSSRPLRRDKVKSTIVAFILHLDDDESFRMIQGDASQIMRCLTGMKFRAVITSPPYFRHRHYGADNHEIGREQTAEEYIQSLTHTFAACRDLLTEDGSLWIVIGDARRQHEKLRIPHRLADRLVQSGNAFRKETFGIKKTTSAAAYETTFLRL